MEINQTILGLIALFTVGMTVFLGAVILATFEQQTSGQCTEGLSTVTNATISQNASEIIHGFVLSSSITGTDAAGNLTVASFNKTTGLCKVSIGAVGAWTQLGFLNNATASDVFQIPASLISTEANINYSECQSNNITLSSISYKSLTGCSYTYNAYKTIKAVNKNVTGVMSIASILPYIMVIVVVLGAFGAFLYLRRD
jgi:hypothetical protein